MNSNVNLRFSLNSEFTSCECAIGFVHRPFDLKKPGTLIPLGIRTFAKTFWNHCFLMFKIEGKWYVLEADTPRVHMIPIEAYEDTKLIEVWPIWFNMCCVGPLKKLSDLKSKAISRVYKTKYAKADLLWFMPIFLATHKFFGRKVDSINNKATCYEYVAWCLGFENWYRMTPIEFKNKVIRICNSNNNEFEITRMGTYQALTLKKLLNS